MGFYLVQVLTGFSSAASLFLVAAGLSIIFGVTRVVNFAHGSFYMLGAFIAVTLVDVLGRSQLGFWSSVLVAALAVGAIGAAIEILILRRIYRAPELLQLLATFGVILVIQDLALWAWGPEDRIGPRLTAFRGAVQILGGRLPIYDLVLIAACPIVLAALWLLFHRTRFGVLVRAATTDREMVAALGVDQRWLFTGVFFLGSCLAGLGGALQLPKGGADLLMDLNVIAGAFVVVVIGGMGSITGAFLAAVLVGQLQAFGILFLPQATLALTFLAMAVVLVLRPQGLLGRADAAEQASAAETSPPLRLTGAWPRLAGATALAALLLLPALVADYALVVAIEILIFALFAASLHAIMGPGGLASFGHAAYFGGGAYAAALLGRYAGAPMELGLAAGILGAASLALVIGYFCVRLKGVYFAMLSLAFAQLLWSGAVQWSEVTGGDDGILGLWPSPWAAPRAVYYYLTLALCGGGILALRHVAATPFGWGLRAARDHARRAEALGLDTARQQWLAFVLAGGCAGLAGALYLYAKGSVFPDELAIPRSFDALMMVLLGGVHAPGGPLAGAFAFTGLQDLLARLAFWRLLLGLSIIGLVLAFPDGIMGTLARRLRPASAPA